MNQYSNMPKCITLEYNIYGSIFKKNELENNANCAQNLILALY